MATNRVHRTEIVPGLILSTTEWAWYGGECLVLDGVLRHDDTLAVQVWSGDGQPINTYVGLRSLRW